MDRRGFLKNVALSASALSAAQFLPGGIATGSPVGAAVATEPIRPSIIPRQTASDPSTAYFDGVVIAVDETGFLVSSPESVASRIQFSPRTILWKGRYGANFNSIETGDKVFVRAYARGSDFEGLNVYSNLAWVRGTINSAADSRLSVATDSGQSEVELLSDTVILSDSSNLFLGSLRVGNYIEALGLQLREGLLRANKVWVVTEE